MSAFGRKLRVGGVPRLGVVLAACALVLAGGPCPLAVGRRHDRRRARPLPDADAHPGATSRSHPTRGRLLFQQAMTEDEEITLLGGDTTGNGPAHRRHLRHPAPRTARHLLQRRPGRTAPGPGDRDADPDGGWRPPGTRRSPSATARRSPARPRPRATTSCSPPRSTSCARPRAGEPTRPTARTPTSSRRRPWAGSRARRAPGVIAVVKHFVANNQEGLNGAPPLAAANGGRQLVDARVDERTLREVYFPQFEAAVKQANTGALMCSYNKVNGTYACENPFTLQQVLEGQWGFPGHRAGRLRRLQGHGRQPQQRPGLRARRGPGRRSPTSRS